MELLPPAKRGGDQSKLPAGNLLGLPKVMISKLRKVYGGLGAADLSELKAQALESGEPLSKAAVRRVVNAVAKAKAKRQAEVRAEEAEAEQQARAEREAAVRHVCRSRSPQIRTAPPSPTKPPLGAYRRFRCRSACPGHVRDTVGHGTRSDTRRQ